MPELYKNILSLLALLLLVLLNGFFVAAEFALVSLQKPRIDQLANTGNRAAKRVQAALSHLDTCFAGTQLGVTMASLALGSIGEPAMAHLLLPLFAMLLPHSVVGISAHAVAFAVGFALVTSLHIVLGELVPKSIAFQRADSAALRLIPVLSVYIAVFRPFIVVLNKTGNRVLKTLGLTPVAGHNAVHSVEELELLVHDSRAAGEINEQQERMVSGVFDFKDTIVRKLMTPRLDITAVDLHCSTEDLLHVVTQSGHSRLPVFDKTLDDIKGIIHVKDVLLDVADGSMDATLAELMRPPYFVPENKRATDLLAELRRKKSQMAVVIDEYGVVSGLVTIEDLLEQIVGDIMDEYDVEEIPLTPINETTWLADGALPLEELTEHLGVELTFEDNPPDTIGGLVFDLLGHQPAVGETVQTNRLQLRVEATDGRRVQKVRVVKLPPASDETESENAETGANS